MSEFDRYHFDDDLPDSSANIGPTWGQMKNRLDKEMPQKRKRRLIYTIYLLALMITGVELVYFAIRPKDTTTKQPAATVSTESKAATAPLTLMDTAAHATSAEATVLTDADKNVHQPSTLPITASVQLPRENSMDQSLPLENINRGKKTTSHTTKATITKTTRSEKLNTVLEVGNKQLFINQPDEQPLTHPIAERSALADSIYTPDSSNQTAGIMPIEKAAQVEQNDSAQVRTAAIKLPPARKPPRWGLFATVAPGFLIPNINHLNRSGYFAGAGVDYIFNSHMRLRAGVLYNANHFEVSGEHYDYQPAHNLPAYSTIQLTKMNERLNVLEIPLSFRYTFNPRQRLMFNVSAGVSSLFFLKKDCTYHLLLDNVNAIEWKDNYEGGDDDDDGKPQILNNISISSGVGFRLTNRVFMEVEPTFKLLLEELGEHHQSIGSLYINFNLRMPLGK